MGGGLGGGSADAAVVLLALPALLGKPLPPDRLMETAATLGSDVPFFLIGGTVLGLDRGTELYPLSDLAPRPVLIVSSGVHVSTADAYRSLARTDSVPHQPNHTARLAQALGQGSEWGTHSCNDFEPSVYGRHPELAQIRRKLEQFKAKPALMTGSGSALFGIFSTTEERDRAAEQFPADWTHRAALLPRLKYRAILARSLRSVC
jgi:4-diphosphocytidyl-2-C-methyl-D-erythritol kinase